LKGLYKDFNSQYNEGKILSLKNKTVLVTGADGFIGSHLTELLIKKNCKVKALSYYNSFNYWGWLDYIRHTNLEIVSGDVRDPFYCQKITEGIDVIFNLAALIAIPYSYIAPQSYVDTNVKGALNICEAALQNGCEKVIQTSTSEVYGTAQYVPIDEKHPLQPQSPYSASKIAADSIAMSFFHAFDLPLTIARPFNTYGPRQSLRAVIPTIITQILNAEKIIQLGDVRPTRDFNYVSDICHGLVLLAENDNTTGEVINIGSNFEISIKDTFYKIRDILNIDVEYSIDKKRLRPKLSEVNRLRCDNSKIIELTGFESQYSFEAGLKKTIEWFKKYTKTNKFKSQIYNV
jgi:NAD dependent epimerase/dehydratase